MESSSHPGRGFDASNTSPVLQTRRPHSSMSGKMGPAGGGHGSRTWHPSPFASDDENEEHQFFKEEKKNRIKMEISRRRQQIEENARLHEELIRLAKLRESAELGTGGPAGHHHHGADHHHHRLGVPGVAGVPGYPSPGTVSPGTGTSILRSVDEILRTTDHHGGGHGRTNHHPARRYYTDHGVDHGGPHHGGGGAGFNADRYTASVYDRVTDFSPVYSDFSSDFPPMPLLPDMPSRSRKLLEDLGTASYGASAGAGGRRNLYR